MDIEDFFEEWDEDDLAELLESLEDDNSSLLKSTCPFSSALPSEDSNLSLLLKLFVNLLYFRVRKWSYLKSSIEERKLEVKKCSWAQSSAELHAKDNTRKALISSSAINPLNTKFSPKIPFLTV